MTRKKKAAHPQAARAQARAFRTPSKGTPTKRAPAKSPKALAQHGAEDLVPLPRGRACRTVVGPYRRPAAA